LAPSGHVKDWFRVKASGKQERLSDSRATAPEKRTGWGWGQITVIRHLHTAWFLHDALVRHAIISANAADPMKNKKKAEQKLGPSPTGRYEEDESVYSITRFESADRR
jgi:hypothetical protein